MGKGSGQMRVWVGAHTTAIIVGGGFKNLGSVGGRNSQGDSEINQLTSTSNLSKIFKLKW